jgi:hypothetical protein
VPHDPLHRIQKRKNIALLLVLLTLIVLIYAITMMRLNG